MTTKKTRVYELAKELGTVNEFVRVLPKEPRVLASHKYVPRRHLKLGRYYG